MKFPFYQFTAKTKYINKYIEEENKQNTDTNDGQTPDAGKLMSDAKNSLKNLGKNFKP